MKHFRLTAAAVAFAALLSTAAHAQAPAARPQPAAPAAGTASSLAGRVAVIDSGAFSDEKEGIARVINAMKTLDAQFQPQRTELQGMQTRYNTLVDQIQKTSAVSDPKTLQTQQDQAEQLKRDMERKAQDAQANYERRSREVLGPLQEDVYKALQTYAQTRGISVVIDLNRVPVLYAADSIDITRDFIADYNRTHPATAAAAPPTGGRP